MKRIVLMFVLAVSIFIGCVPCVSADYGADIRSTL